MINSFGILTTPQCDINFIHNFCFIIGKRTTMEGEGGERRSRWIPIGRVSRADGGERSASDYVYLIPGRNPLIEPNNVRVLADVENESTGGRVSEPVRINHGRPVYTAGLFSRTQSAADLSSRSHLSRVFVSSLASLLPVLPIRLLAPAFFFPPR